MTAPTPRPVREAPQSDPRPATRPAQVAGGKAHWDALTTEEIAAGGLTWKQVRDGYQPGDDPVLRAVEPLPGSATVPQNLRTTARTTTSIATTWDAVTGATSYRLRDNGVDVTGATALATPGFNHTGLTANSTHNYTVSALISATRGGESRELTVKVVAS